MPEDAALLELFSNALDVCKKYKPQLGRGRSAGLSLEQFQQLYSADPFYNWVGLDSPLMYAAHKAAGGMTSVYRQLGIGGQWVFKELLKRQLALTDEQAGWSYQVPKPDGTARTLALDGRIEFADVKNKSARQRVRKWTIAAARKLLVPPEAVSQLRGVVFEVRQGYKSKDSKRQNADLANAASAYSALYLPALFLLSTQIDSDLATRYTAAKWSLLRGTVGGSALESSYSFCREVLEYDLAAFFRRNSKQIQAKVHAVLETLLHA